MRWIVLTAYSAIMFIACLEHGLSLYSVSEDMSLSVQTADVIQSILKPHFEPRCSLLLITDGMVESIALRKIATDIKIEGGTIVYELNIQATNVNETATNLFRYIDQFQQLSRCLAVILTSDDISFLETFTSMSVRRSVVLWSTKFLLLTSIQFQKLSDMHEAFAVINGMIISMEKDVRRYNIYSIIPYSLRPIKLATWTKNRGLITDRVLHLFPEKFYKLPDSAHLIAAGEEYPPHCSLKEIPATASTEKRLEFSGPMILTLNILANSMNFTYGLTRPPDQSWGYQLPDGSWVGMVGMVRRHEVDMALGPFGINPLRKSVVDFTRTMLVDYVRITAKMGNAEVDPFGFAMPLAPLVWALTFLTLFLVILCVILLSYFTDFESSADKIVETFSFFRIFLQQDILIRDNKWWERVMIAGWMLTTLILTKSYSGNLMSLLAVRYIPQPLQSLRKVMDDPSITLVWESNTEYTQYIQSVDSGIFHELAQSEAIGRMAYTTGSEYGTTLDNLVMRGDHVLIIEDLSLRMLLAEHFTKSGKCEFYMSSELFLPSAMAMITQKNSPLGPAMDKRIRALTESGLYTHWIQNAVPNSTSCSNPPKRITVESTLKIDNIWGMFVVLVCGYIISTLTLCLEGCISALQ